MTAIGVDLGGTQLRAGRLDGAALGPVTTSRVPAAGSAEEILAALYAAIDPLIDASVRAIGVGVPSLVDPDHGWVRAVPNLPAWRDVPLAQILAERYRRPIHVDNDANAFVIGEHRHGAARGRAHVVGLVLGTGVGAGAIVDGRLHRGRNGGAGEVGLLPYRGRTFEDWCGGAFFVREHGATGEALHAAATSGHARARATFAELGAHLADLVLAIVATFDPAMIVLGGSVSRALPLFEGSLRAGLRGYAYPTSIDRLELAPAALEHPGVVGAAALALEHAR